MKWLLFSLAVGLFAYAVSIQQTYQVLDGFFLALFVQAVLLAAVVANKIRSTLNSSGIKIRITRVIEPPRLPPHVRQKKLYLNKFTEEAKLTKLMQERQLAHEGILKSMKREQSYLQKDDRPSRFFAKVATVRSALVEFQESFKGLGLSLDSFNHRKQIFHDSQFSFIQDQLPIFKCNIVEKGARINILPSWKAVLFCINDLGKRLLMMQKSSETVTLTQKHLQNVFESYEQEIESIRSEVAKLRQSLDGRRAGMKSAAGWSEEFHRNSEDIKEESNIESKIIQKVAKLQKLFKNREQFQVSNSRHIFNMVSMLVGSLEEFKGVLREAQHRIVQRLQIEPVGAFEEPEEVHFPPLALDQSPNEMTKRTSELISKVKQMAIKKALSSDILLKKLEETQLFILSLGSYLVRANEGLRKATNLRLQSCKYSQYFSSCLQVLARVEQALSERISEVQRLQSANKAYEAESRKFLQLVNQKMEIELQSLAYVREQTQSLLQSFNFISEFKRGYQKLHLLLEKGTGELESLFAQHRQFQNDYYKHLEGVKEQVVRIIIRLVNSLHRAVSEVPVQFEQEQEQRTQAEFQQRANFKLEQQEEQEEARVGSLTISHLNVFLFSLYQLWKTSPLFSESIKKKLVEALNVNRHEYLEEIRVKKIKLGGEAPELLWIKKLKHQEHELLLDLSLSFTGTLELEARTNVNIKGTKVVNVEMRLKMDHLAANLRLCLVPSMVGKGWFSFLSQPATNIEIVPLFNNYDLGMFLESLMKGTIQEALGSKVLPVRSGLRLPLSKKKEKEKEENILLEIVLRRLQEIG